MVTSAVHTAAELLSGWKWELQKRCQLCFSLKTPADWLSSASTRLPGCNLPPPFHPLFIYSATSSFPFLSHLLVFIYLLFLPSMFLIILPSLRQYVISFHCSPPPPPRPSTSFCFCTLFLPRSFLRVYSDILDFLSLHQVARSPSCTHYQGNRFLITAPAKMIVCPSVPPPRNGDDNRDKPVSEAVQTLAHQRDLAWAGNALMIILCEEYILRNQPPPTHTHTHTLHGEQENPSVSVSAQTETSFTR